MNEQQNKTETPERRGQKRPERRGFYLALAVCVAAVGIAAWSTYDTVSDYLEPESTAAHSTATPHAAATRSPAAVATPAPAADDPERSTASGHGQGTAEEITVTPRETPAPTEAPAAASTEPAEPAEEPDAEAEPHADVDAETAATLPEYTVSDGFLLPVSSGTVLAPFSDAPVYSATMRDYRAHAGVDLAAAHGETVKAVANGVVTETHTDMLRGNMIVIEHGDYTVSYCGLGETFLVAPGEVVDAGQDIGSVTAAPFESAMDSHLHVEFRKDGVPVDPMELLG